MRDLKSLLLESQVVDQNHTVNKALELNGTILKLREEKEELTKADRCRHDREVELVRHNDIQREALNVSSLEKKKLKEEIKRQKLNMESMFEELEESRKQAARLRDQLIGKECDDPAKRPNLRDRLAKLGSQADLLANAVDKMTPSSGGFFASLSGSSGAAATPQKKIHGLERENLRLKSDLVRLQAQYREESYLSSKTIEELVEENDTTATMALDNSIETLSDSDASLSSECMEATRPALNRSNSLQRIKRYREREVSHTRSPNLGLPRSPIVPPQRTISTCGATGGPRGSRLVDMDGGDRSPSNHRDASPALSPRCIQSIWPATTASVNERPPIIIIENRNLSTTTCRSPRHIQSLQQPFFDKDHLNEVNLHDLAQPRSQPPFFGRSQSVQRKAWW